MNKRSAVFLFLFILIWLLAPRYHAWIGHSDESAWVQFFMVPSGLVGIVLCLANISLKNRPKVKTTLTMMIYIVFIFHVLVASGFHPR